MTGVDDGIDKGGSGPGKEDEVNDEVEDPCHRGESLNCSGGVVVVAHLSGCALNVLGSDKADDGEQGDESETNVRSKTGLGSPPPLQMRRRPRYSPHTQGQLNLDHENHGESDGTKKRAHEA